MSETADVVQPVLLALNAAYPMGIWLRRNVGGTKVGDRFIKFGRKGMADVHGIFHGRAFEIECKRASVNSLRQHQQYWRSAVLRAGGFHLATSDPELTVREVARWLGDQGISVRDARRG